MAVVITPNMSLIEPSIGNTPSPTWAEDLNIDMGIIDSHSHAPGSGVAITPNAMNINSDLPFGGNNAIALRTSRYLVQSAVLSGASDLACSYAVGTAGDLYWNDASGNKIQITASGGVAGTPGSIANLVAPASASFVSATSTFVWQSAVSTAANMDAATLIVRYPGSYPTPSGNYIAIQAPSALASGYAITLPALPSSTSFLTIDTAGNLSGSISTSAGIINSNIANSTITGAKIASATITATNIANSTITLLQIANNTITSTQISLTAGITRAQTAPFGEQVSPTTPISFSTSAVTPTSVTGLSVSITTTGGRAVRLSLVPEITAVPYATLVCTLSGTTGQALVVGYRINLMETGASRQFAFIQNTIYTRLSSNDTLQHFFNPCFTAVDTATTGVSATYTYTVQIQGYAPNGAGGATAIQITNVRLMAEEMP